jgi:hypothetical protein
MRFGHLLEFLNQYVIPAIKDTKINGTQEGVPIIGINNGPWDNFMYTVPYQVSLDPRVCIVKSAEDISQKSWFQQLDPWKNPEFGYAWTMNIYISHNQILESLTLDEKGNIALFDFLDNLCTAINKAMGGVNNLEPVIDEETQTINIIDSSYSVNEEADYNLELYGYKDYESTFVRSFDLKTEITNDFATMATVGSTAGGYVKGVENTMFSKWNKGLIDPWKEKYIPPQATSNVSGSENDPATQYTIEFWNKYFSPYGYTVNKNGVCLNDEIIDKNVAIVTEFYKYMQAKAYEKKSTYSSPTNGFVPISLGVTLDGLSGIKIYNAVNVDTRFLPRNYPDNLKFIIKGVNHKLSNSDWETNFETVVISRNEEETDATYSFLKETVDEILVETLKYNPPQAASWLQPLLNTLTCPAINFKKDDPAARVSQKEVAEYTYNLFPELSSKAIAGLLGHLNYESGGSRKTFNPTAFNSTGGGCGALGIAQWRGERQVKLSNFTTNLGSFTSQMDFVKKELQSSFSEVYQILKNPNLEPIQYLAAVHISYGLGNSNPYEYINSIKTIQDYTTVYLNKNGQNPNSIPERLKHTNEILQILNSL